MTEKIFTILLICLVGFGHTAPTTDYPHTTIPNYTHSESGQINFAYDAALRQLIGITDSKCYLAPLTHDEQAQIHSSRGTTDLEEAMIRDWIGKLPETRIYYDDFHLPAETGKWCAHKDIFLLERILHAVTSPKTTF